jgi:hypothetical protein
MHILIITEAIGAVFRPLVKSRINLWGAGGFSYTEAQIFEPSKAPPPKSDVDIFFNELDTFLTQYSKRIGKFAEGPRVKLNNFQSGGLSPDSYISSGIIKFDSIPKLFVFLERGRDISSNTVTIFSTNLPYQADFQARIKEWIDKKIAFEKAVKEWLENSGAIMKNPAARPQGIRTASAA